MLNIDNILKNKLKIIFNNYFLIFLLVFSILYISFIKPNYISIHNIIYNLNFLFLTLIFIYIYYGINNKQKIYIILSLFLIKVIYLNINNINLQNYIIDLYFKKNIDKNIKNRIIKIQVNMLPRKNFFGGKTNKKLTKQLLNKNNDLYSLYKTQNKFYNIENKSIKNINDNTNKIEKILKKNKFLISNIFSNNKNNFNTWCKITNSSNIEFQNKGGNSNQYNTTIKNLLDEYRAVEENLDLE